MKVIYKYWKNSNTNELRQSQEFTETNIKGIPTYYYDTEDKRIGEDLNEIGFVEISRKKWDREKRKLKTKSMETPTKTERTYIILITALATVITALCAVQIVINF